MKKTLLYLPTLLLFVTLSFNSFRASAGAAAGGEIFYEWIADSTYKFYFKYYKDCTGAPEPLIQPLCFYNTCNNTSFTVNMGIYSYTAAPLVNNCGYKTKCDSPSSTISAYATIWYYNTVTMPSQCSEWKIFTYMGSRINSTNLLNATLSDMYIEATMNNTGSYQGNNSPYFSVGGIIYPCVTNPFTYNAGAIDPDGDSLVTEIIQPRTGVSSCSNTPINAPFAAATPPYNVSMNPIQSNNSFSVYSATGKMDMVPTLAGVATLAIRVKEYRNGVLIGSIMREMPVNVMNCTPPPITVSYPCQSGIYINPATNTATGCVTVPFTFCVKAISTDTNAKIYLSDDHLVSLPQASVGIIGQNTDTAEMTVSWAPGINDGGNWQLGITVTDNSCYYPGVPTVKTFHLPMYIAPATEINIDDTTICASQPIKLSVTGGGVFTWEKITAIDTTTIWATSFSDTPLISTKYVVTSNQTSYCPLHKDSIDVTVLPVKNPVISIQAMPDTVISSGQQVIFGIANTDCNNPSYQWQLNGVDIQGADSSTWVSNSLNDMDVVNCRMICNDSCATDTISNPVTIHVVNGIHEIHSLSGVALYPNPNSGTFMISGYTYESSILKLSVTNMIGQELYTEQHYTGAGIFRKTVHVNNLPDGIYILKLEGNNETIIKRFNIVR